jgi:hypothetical protein
MWVSLKRRNRLPQMPEPVERIDDPSRGAAKEPEGGLNDSRLARPRDAGKPEPRSTPEDHPRLH